jgi:hypothetical protein
MRASSGGSGAIAELTELPAALPAEEAKKWVEQRLAKQWQGASSVRLRLPPSRLGLKPGDRIQLPGSTRSMTVNSAEIDGMAVVIEAEPTAADISSLPADPGRPVPDPDEPIGRSELALFELPPLGDTPESAPRLFAAASNQGKWKPIPIELWLGLEPMAGQVLGRRAVLGSTTTHLDARSPLTLDELSSVTVKLVNSGHVLLNASADAMSAGANLAMIGDELIQFGRAEQLEPGLFRLSRMLRGRRGTEWASTTHNPGERFCLFNLAALAVLDLPAGTTGAALKAVSHGIADAAPLPEALRPVSGEAMRPPSICHLRGSRDGSSLCLSWVRRTHFGWAWNNGVGVSDDSFPECYRVTISGPAGQLEMESGTPVLIVDVASLPGEVGETVKIEIRMTGLMAMSQPRAISLTL